MAMTTSRGRGATERWTVLELWAVVVMLSGSLVRMDDGDIDLNRV